MIATISMMGATIALGDYAGLVFLFDLPKKIGKLFLIGY